MNWSLFEAFLGLAILLMLAPGPIVTLVIATGASQGTRAALVTVAGTSTGNALLLAAIASGLGFVVSHAAPAFEVLRWAGAAYLIFLGIQTLRGGRAARFELPPHRALFRRGVLVALSNPKTIAFFTAFLPQFIDPTLPAWRQLTAMCAASVAIAAVTDSGWAVAASLGRTWLVRPRWAKRLTQLSGAALIGGGVWLSLTRRPG